MCRQDLEGQRLRSSPIRYSSEGGHKFAEREKCGHQVQVQRISIREKLYKNIL